MSSRERSPRGNFLSIILWGVTLLGLIFILLIHICPHTIQSDVFAFVKVVNTTTSTSFFVGVTGMKGVITKNQFLKILLFQALNYVQKTISVAGFWILLVRSNIYDSSSSFWHVLV